MAAWAYRYGFCASGRGKREGKNSGKNFQKSFFFKKNKNVIWKNKNGL
jgi:hypothetical protein